jgi:hypothetical protein
MELLLKREHGAVKDEKAAARGGKRRLARQPWLQQALSGRQITSSG